jgi:phage terminase large subunit GpA-like protein
VAKKLRLSTKSNLLEKVDLSLTPYLIDPISLIGNYKIHWIGIIAPTQSGKTVFLQVAVADAIDQDPGPFLYVLPDEKTSKKAIDEKLISIVEKSPNLSIHKTGKVKDISHSQIKLDNMTITPAWAGSIPTMNMVPYKRAALDEVRLMPLTTGNESNAIKLTGDRLTTYREYGIAQAYLVSSPSTEGDLLHQQLSIPGTLLVTWSVPCPHCGLFQILNFFANLKNIKSNPQCLCKECGEPFLDHDKKKSWNKNGKYVYVTFNDNKWTPIPEQSFDYSKYTRVFFHWDSMVSPFRSFKTIAKEYLETKDKLHDYKNFVQCWLAQFWIEDKSKANSISLNEKKEPNHIKGDVPEWVKLLTCGIDTQDSGFYCVIRGWGQNKFTIVIDEFYVPCQLGTTGEKEIKSFFSRDIFDRLYRSSDGSHWKVAIAAIDTGGHKTKEIYTAAFNFKRLLLIKGAHENQNVTIQYSKDYGIYLVRTMEYLDETDIRSQAKEFILPSNISKDYINQFCNIRRTENQNKVTGEKKVIWKKMGQCDYRMADVHAFICLDIPTDRGTFRAEIEKDTFKYNPYTEAINIQKVLSNRNNPQEEFLDYTIPEVNW